MTQAWFLLADTDRGPDQQIDLDTAVETIVIPFVTASDAHLRANGFMALSCLFNVSQKAAAGVLTKNGVVLKTILDVCGYSQTGDEDTIMGGDMSGFSVGSVEDRFLQLWAVDVLVGGMRDLGIRQSIVK